MVASLPVCGVGVDERVGMGVTDGVAVGGKTARGWNLDLLSFSSKRPAHMGATVGNGAAANPGTLHPYTIINSASAVMDSIGVDIFIE